MHPLTVYKASAGSGKTFTLAVEFIKLLILNPRKYENILAVTFTNKATEEMKHRIVSQLYGLSHGLRSSDSYLDKITKELDVSEEFVRRNADIALHNLLHNYNQFRVQTIDAFFQSILRNMVKELGLGNNLRISLNDSQVISEAVDSIMETLDKDKALMSWIIEYVNERMDDQKSWDITGEVKSFGMNLSKEFFKSNEHLLKSIANDKDFFSRYKKAMTAIIRGAEAHFKECGEYFLTMLSNAGYDVSDLVFGKNGVAGYFLKLKDGDFTRDSIVGARVLAAMNDPMKWGTKKKLDVNAQAEHFLQIRQALNDFADGKISEETFDLFWNGAHYANDVALAREEGEVNGRNSKIEAERLQSKARKASAPTLGGRGGASEEDDGNRKSGIMEMFGVPIKR